MNEIGKEKYLGIAFFLGGLINIFETYMKWRLGLYEGGVGGGVRVRVRVILGVKVSMICIF